MMNSSVLYLAFDTGLRYLKDITKALKAARLSPNDHSWLPSSFAEIKSLHEDLKKLREVPTNKHKEYQSRKLYSNVAVGEFMKLWDNIYKFASEIKESSKSGFVLETTFDSNTVSDQTIVIKNISNKGRLEGPDITKLNYGKVFDYLMDERATDISDEIQYFLKQLRTCATKLPVEQNIQDFLVGLTKLLEIRKGKINE